jgi:hypothetical protein
MNRIALTLFFFVSAVMPPASATAATLVFDAELSGLQEVPPNVSPGSGLAIVTIDDVLKTMRVQASFSGLLGTTTASHIHCCALPGFAAPVATQTPSFMGFPLGVTSGTFDNTFDLTSASSYRAGFITDHGGTVTGAYEALLAGLVSGSAYYNIHTSVFPGGELRGQLQAVPEISTWAMMLLGFGFVGGGLRAAKRRQKLTVSFS